MLRANEIKNSNYVGKEVTIRGWVYRIRKQKENAFILLRDDRGGIIQTIFPLKTAAHLTVESSIEVVGIVQHDVRAPEGNYEVKGKRIKTFNVAENTFPIGEYQSIELLLDNRHLALRTRRMIEIAKIRNSVLKFARDWFIKNDWMEITPPTIVKAAVEGGSTLFKLKYFDDCANLSQSAQLYLEAMIFCLGPVWSLTSSFRAERSRTIRHLAEFSHLEAEAPWIALDDILKIEENLIWYVVQNTIKERSDSFAVLKIDLYNLKAIQIPFKRLTYEDAIEALRSKQIEITEPEGQKRTIQVGDDLNIDSERELTKSTSEPVFITGYPIEVKPFYVKEDPNHKGRALAADLIAPGGFGEISSGGEREDDIDVIKTKIQKEGLNADAYSWYLDLRRYGSVPHGGFGLGIERLVRWLVNLDDIKDTVLFPRTMSRVVP
ncbi:MAG TPA: asparagine--tRNA ligase [Nitrososphaeraceae archaeon]|nr:asparagine--tRNA ligase [Nitrososphaeraceae archaeon]